ncbi:MAG: triose-phosphate isomerase [Defluviitaleaceae bacterium]|nr:triose-phosphate isomerase [Defluviitaleaceae bacterium]
MRKMLIAGNWKMNFTPSNAVGFVNSIKSNIDTAKRDVVLCVPYVALQPVKDALKGTNIQVGAQNVHYMDDGAYTGEISPAMLNEMKVPYVIIGHSERREKFGESDTTVNLRALRALKHGLSPIICVGESQKQRLANRTEDVLRKQVAFALDEVKDERAEKVVIAYEPIWAIGTGMTATTKQAEDACAFIRILLIERFGAPTAEKIRILYGGSVTPTNAAELFSQPNIDGGLVGGASTAPTFDQVVKAGLCCE